MIFPRYYKYYTGKLEKEQKLQFQTCDHGNNISSMSLIPEFHFGTHRHSNLRSLLVVALFPDSR